MNHRHQPPEPPIPDPEGYPLTHRAVVRESRVRRLVRQIGTPGWIAALAFVGIAGVGVWVVAHDNPARASADRAAVAASTAGPLRVKSPEYAPPVPDQIAGDGMWIVGKQIKPGVYQSNAGTSCYWERLAGLSGKYEDLLDNGGFRRGPKLVEVKATDFAFTSQGCGTWVMVR